MRLVIFVVLKIFYCLCRYICCCYGVLYIFGFFGGRELCMIEYLFFVIFDLCFGKKDIYVFCNIFGNLKVGGI